MRLALLCLNAHGVSQCYLPKEEEVNVLYVLYVLYVLTILIYIVLAAPACHSSHSAARDGHMFDQLRAACQIGMVKLAISCNPSVPFDLSVASLAS